MSLKRTLAVRLPLAVAAATAGSMLLGFGGVLVCSTYPTLKVVDIDCSVEEGYTFEDIDNFDTLRWWTSTDLMPDGGCQTVENAATCENGSDHLASSSVTAATPIPEGPLCGNSEAGVFHASHNNDWGCVFGMWGFNDTEQETPRSASEWQGISFWARAPGNTTKGVTILLDDDNTAGEAVGKRCRDYSVDGGIEGQPSSTTTITDPGTGTPITGSSTTRAAYPDECGNGYFVNLQLTSEWRFYTIPWSRFQQNLTPNRVPNEALAADPGDLDAGTTILTSRLRRLTLRLPKEAEMDLWLAKLSFYRKNVQ